MNNIDVDRAANKEYCCGSRRKLKTLLWIAQKMKHIAVERTENEQY